MTSSVAFVGVGAMGGPLAEHVLEQGWQVFVYDADPTRVEAVVAVGGKELVDLGTARDKADWIVLSLPGPAEVAATVQEILAGSGTTARARGILDLTSSEPSTSRALHEQAQTRSIGYLDAGVLGNPPLARTGSLILLLGEREEGLEAYREVLDVVSRATYWLGQPGAGHAAKLAANELFTAQVAAMAEALTVLDGVQADTGVFLDALASTGGRGVGLADIGRTMVGDAPAAGFALRLAAKDVRLFLAMSADLGVELPVLSGLATLYSAASESTPTDDYTRLYHHLARSQSANT